MAITCQLIEYLASGAKDSAGAALNGGKVRFYQPGTLTPQNVFQDQAALTAYPAGAITLSAGGTATVFMHEPVRMIVKDSTETTTHLDAIIGLTREDTTYVTSNGFNSGNETRLENILVSAYTSFNGRDWKLLPDGGTTPLTLIDFANGVHVDIRSFGAIGDDSTDNLTAIQNAINHVESLGGGTLHIPDGIFRVSNKLTCDFSGLSIAGLGPSVSVLKFTHATQPGIQYNGGVSIDDLSLRNIGITHATASSGSAIEGGSGVGRMVFDTVHTDGFATGMGATDGPLYMSGCVLDANTTSMDHSNVQATGCTFGRTVNAGGASAVFFGCDFNGTPGMLVSTGFPILIGCDISTATITSASDGLIEIGKRSAITVTGSGTAYQYSLTPAVVVAEGAIGTTAVTTSFTPGTTSTGANTVYHYRGTAGGITITVNNPSGTAALGRSLTIMCENSSGGAVTWTFGANYRTSAAVAPATGNVTAVTFEYETRNNVWRETGRSTSTV